LLTVACLRSTSGDYYLAYEDLAYEDLAYEDLARDVLAHDEGPGSASRRRGGDDRDGGGRDLLTDSGRGRWLGAQARSLGLRGAVRSSELDGLLGGGHPGTARPLRSGDGVEVSAYDLCFSAPKSVSILWGTASPEVAHAILGSHRAAVGRALDYVERRALAARRRAGGERAVIATGGVIGAGFDHGASRAGDPHLHTHVVVPNLVHGVDGRWTVADGRGLFAHAAAAGSLYEAELRGELSRHLGVGWARRRNGQIEAAIVGPTVIGEFSGRRGEIAEHLWRRSSASWEAGRIAWAQTRDRKDPSERLADRAGRWSSRAERAGLGLPLLERQAGAVRDDPSRATIDERFLAAALSVRRVVTRRDVVRAWGAAVLDGAPATEVEASVDHWVRDDSVGVTESRRSPSEVLVPSHLLDLLGPRPVASARQPTWRRAAEEIEAYRVRWDVRDPVDELRGGGRVALRAGGPPQLAHQLSVRRSIDETNRALGRPRVEREPLGRGIGY